MALYLLASAVNLAATIFDGNDLSVIRGSSARLLQASEDLFQHLDETFNGRAQVDRLAVGASELLIRLTAPTAARGRVNFEAPFGADQAWRRNGLPALVQRVRGGSSPEQTADDFIASNHERIKAKQVEAKRRSIIAQINAQLAAATAAGALPEAADASAAVDAFFALPAQRKLRHFTFVYACHSATSGERLCDILAALYSKLRERQLQSPTLALPDIASPMPAASRAFCAYTLGRRPAVPRTVRGQPISASALSRRSNGRFQKQRFYMVQLARSADAAFRLQDDVARNRLEESLTALEADDIVFAHDFDAIVADPPPGLPPNVQNKLAVLFMDGNDFGRRRSECATLAESRGAHDAYRRFCLALERNGGLILAGLLDWMRKEPRFVGTDGRGRHLRFETLMFGGDDICLVMPAWGAFALLAKLGNILSDLRVPNVQGDPQPVAFGIGVAMADRRSPIRDIREVARRLSDAAKDTGRSQSIVHVMALEGLDRADLHPVRLRRELFGGPGHDEGAAEKGSAAFGLALADMSRIVDLVEEIGRDVGRSQLHKWYRQAEDSLDGDGKSLLRRPGEDDEVKAFVSVFDERLGDLGASETVRNALTGRAPILAAGAADWPLLPLHHVLTLADYIEAMPLAAPAARAAA